MRATAHRIRPPRLLATAAPHSPTGSPSSVPRRTGRAAGPTAVSRRDHRVPADPPGRRASTSREVGRHAAVQPVDVRRRHRRTTRRRPGRCRRDRTALHTALPIIDATLHGRQLLRRCSRRQPGRLPLHTTRRRRHSGWGRRCRTPRRSRCAECASGSWERRRPSSSTSSRGPASGPQWSTSGSPTRASWSRSTGGGKYGEGLEAATARWHEKQREDFVRSFPEVRTVVRVVWADLVEPERLRAKLLERHPVPVISDGSTRAATSASGAPPPGRTVSSWPDSTTTGRSCRCRPPRSSPTPATTGPRRPTARRGGRRCSTA